MLKQAVRKPLEAVLRYLETHPRPPKPDPVKSVSGVLGGLTPARPAPVINNGSPTILGKRSYEQHNGVDGESGGEARGARTPGGASCGPGRLAPCPPRRPLTVSSLPLSCGRALPGNMKKRLLMPSRGKAMAGRRVVLCVLCSRMRGARRAARARPRGSPRGPGRTPPPLCSRHLAKRQAQQMGHQLPKRRSLSPGGGVAFLSCPGAWSVDCPRPRGPGGPAARPHCLPSHCLPACPQLPLGRPPALCLQRVRPAWWAVDGRSCGRGGRG